MKKKFSLIDDSKKPDRVADQIRSEVKRYIKRERAKVLPKRVDYWDFDCRIGLTEAKAEEIHVSKISEGISKMVSDEVKEFYLEILSKPAVRQKKPRETKES